MDKTQQVVAWLEQAGGRRVRVSGNNAISTCPFHKDQHPSFAMNTTNGLYVCYSASCGAKGNLVQFLVQALRVPVHKALDVVRSPEWATEWENGEEALATHSVPWEDRRRHNRALATKSEADLVLYDMVPLYMVRRGFTEDTLFKWQIGFNPVSKRVTIPVRDYLGRLVGVSERAVLGHQQPKYLHNGFSKGQYLYGDHMVNLSGLQEVWVTEGQLDAIALNQVAPHLKAVSTMGALVSDEQVRLMLKYQRVVLAFDADDAGRAATVRVGEALMGKVDVYVADAYPEGMKDPGDLLYCAVGFFIRDLKPYDLWRLTEPALVKLSSLPRKGRVGGERSPLNRRSKPTRNRPA